MLTFALSSMQKAPKITVILPFYNADKTLDRAISSIAEQNEKDFECILIDNNSTDNGNTIATEWIKKDNRFKLIEEKQQGVMFASNAGSMIANGKYISRMDADDWAYPHRLKCKSQFLDKHLEYGVVAGLVEHIGHKEETKGLARYVDWNNSIQSYSDIIKKQFIESPIINPSAMWRKEVANKYGMYQSGGFPEDYEMWLRWLSKGVKMCKVPEVVLKWHDSDTRLTRTHKRYSDKAFYAIKTKYLALWLRKYNPFHPYVGIWGASKISRRRAKLLEPYGIKPQVYIDTKKGRQIELEVIYYRDTPPAEELFILTYIKQMNARDQIQKFLHKKGYQEGVNYLLVS